MTDVPAPDVTVQATVLDDLDRLIAHHEAVAEHWRTVRRGVLAAGLPEALADPDDERF